jgi:anaerobic magnesium-protoporphyrin IX monomethyl ester cyclase
MSKENINILLAQVGPNSGAYLFRAHPLGQMYLAAYVERELPGVEVKALDLKVAPERIEDLGRIARDCGAAVVGLHAMSVHADMLYRAAAIVKSENPGTVILAGGPHATCFPKQTLATGNFDAVVQGEGEIGLTEILKSLRDGRPLDGIPSVVTTRTGEPPPRAVVENLDALPFPAWHKIDLEAYWRYSSFSILGVRRYMSIFSSRACPYGCIYCHNIFGKKFRARSAENVLSEIRTLDEKYGVRDFDVLDDVFNLKRERVVAICRSLIDNSPKVRLAFPNGLRSDLLDDDLLELMREAGTTYISFAIETASPRLQKLIKKDLDLGKVARAIRKGAKLGIFCNAFVMVGFPTETERELSESIRFAVQSPLDTIHLLKVTPFKGTPLYEMINERTREFIAGRPDKFQYEDRSFNLSEVPNRRFKRIVRAAFLRFYLNPFRAIGIIRHHPDPKQILKFIHVAIWRIFIKG